MSLSHYLSQQTIKFISQTIIKFNYSRPVLQIPKFLLPYSFQLSSHIKKLCPQGVQIYILYDSMKKECCTDIIGAKHVNYDGLFHFGYACFSQEMRQNHWYILPDKKCPKLQQDFSSQDFLQSLQQKKIKLIVCDQSLYNLLKQFREKLLQNFGIDLARLPFDKRQSDRYFGFGYYCIQQIKQAQILVINQQTNQQQNPTSTLLLQNLFLSSKSIGISSIWNYTPQQGTSQYSPANNKILNMRVSQIWQLPQYTTFGILVSNPSTKFCHAQIARCRELLEAKGLKHFTFMMNNLNQCKLGNFPEIEVYVIICCYNYSLYTKKDFYRLVVTPYDLEVAFGASQFDRYQVDLSKEVKRNKIEKASSEMKEEHIEEGLKNELMKTNNEVAILSKLQTLDFYRQRQYKGLAFQEKKEVEKVKKGKIGIAAQYKKLSQD